MKLWGGKTSPTVTVTVTTPRAPFHICPPRSASAPAGSEVTRGEEHSKTGGASAARASEPSGSGRLYLARKGRNNSCEECNRAGQTPYGPRRWNPNGAWLCRGSVPANPEPSLNNSCRHRKVSIKPGGATKTLPPPPRSPSPPPVL